MRYPPEHKESTRARLLEVGGALAMKDGFASTGVDGLMAAVGLTSGAFYSHFRSKAELLEPIVESELGRSLSLLAGKTDAHLVAVLESYRMSASHVDQPAQGCALTTLSTEVARSSVGTREIFERMMIRIKDELGAHLADDDQTMGDDLADGGGGHHRPRHGIRGGTQRLAGGGDAAVPGDDRQVTRGEE